MYFAHLDADAQFSRAPLFRVHVAADRAAARRKVMNSSTINLLLVEDSPSDAKLIEFALDGGHQSFHLTHVETLAAAREHLGSVKTDIILLDLHLPDSDGVDTVRVARRMAPTVPIVVTTGRDDLSIAQIIEAGGIDILSKNRLESDGLARCVRHALEAAHAGKHDHRVPERQRRHAQRHVRRRRRHVQDQDPL